MSIEENVNRIAAEKGYIVLNTRFNKLTDKVKLKCIKHDNVWQLSAYTIIYSKSVCKMCHYNIPPIKELKDDIKSKDAVLINHTLKGRLKLTIKCLKHNHIWETNLKTIKRGHWCSVCGNENKKITHSQITDVVEKKNGKLLTKDCSSATQKIKIKCNKDNHIWTTTWHRINQGCWCPKCNGCLPYSIKDIKKIVKEKDGTLLTKNFKNVKQKIKIRCSCGNIFKSVATFVINRGVWCQICDKKHSVQKDLYNIIKVLYPKYTVKYNCRDFKWLKSSKTTHVRMEIDIFVYNSDKSFTLGIEYDGKQHFEEVRFSNSQSDQSMRKVLAEIKKRDTIKNKLIAQHQDEVKYFIRFNYKDIIDKESVIEKLKENNIPIERI